jgi:hypothetical protein
MVARFLLVHLGRYDPPKVTAGQVLYLAMKRLGMRAESNKTRTKCFDELARGLATTSAHVAAICDDTACIDHETARIFADRTGVPVAYWIQLRKVPA